MNKMDIERMQRLEDMELGQRRKIEDLKKTIDVQTLTIAKLSGANEALTELIVRLKKGE